MKKTLAFAAFLILSLTFLLSSCMNMSFLPQDTNPPKIETAEQALAKISEKMDSLKSYRAEGTLDITGPISSLGMHLHISANDLSIVQMSNNKASYYYENQDMTVTVGAEEMTAKNTMAFNDEKLFFVGEMDNKEKRFYSTCTANEFNSFCEGVTSLGRPLTEGYSDSALAMTPSGGYTVTLKNYDQETINRLNASYGLPFEEDGGKISDITITLNVDSEFLLTESTVDYSFSDRSFSGSRTVIYSQYGSAEKITDGLSTQNYTEIGDVRAVILYSSLISQKQEKVSDSFDFSYTQKFSTYGTSTKKTENDKVRFGTENGSYYFVVNSDVDGRKSTVTYRDGEYRKDGALESSNYSDYEAKKFIDGLIEPFPISFLDVGTVISSPTEKGMLYTFEIDSLDMQFYFKELLESANMYYSNATMSVEMLVKDYELVSLRYIVVGKGSISVSSNVRYDATLEFDVTVSYDSSEPDL